MTGTMRAVVKTAAAPGNIELRTLPIPQIGPRDILVRVKAAAVCGTDVHIRHWNAWAQARMHRRWSSATSFPERWWRPAARSTP